MKNLSKIIILIILSMSQRTFIMANIFGPVVKKTKETAMTMKETAMTTAIKAKTTACSNVVILGAQWAATQAGLETAKAALKAAETLQKTDPRLVGLLTAQKAANVALDSLIAMQKITEGKATADINASIDAALSNIRSKINELADERKKTEQKNIDNIKKAQLSLQPLIDKSNDLKQKLDDANRDCKKMIVIKG